MLNIALAQMPLPNEITMQGNMTLLLLVDVVGVSIGLFFLFWMFRVREKLGGKMKKAMNLIFGGVVFNVTAFTWTLGSTLLGIPHSPTSSGIHHLFMAVGMVLFVFAAKKFSEIVTPSQ